MYPDQSSTEETLIHSGVCSRRGVLRTALAGGLAALAARVAPARAEANQPRAAIQARKSAKGQVREYWLSAEPLYHNLVPSGYDSMMGRAYTPDQTSFMGLGYRAFTPQWGHPLAGDPRNGANLGIPGPVLRANVGDTVVVHFRNNDTLYGFPHSFHAHGLFYDPETDGAWTGMTPGRPGTAVKPGESYTYTYQVVPGSVGTWPYHDHSAPQSIGKAAPDPELGVMLGLFGVFAIDDEHTLEAARENVLIFHDVYAENIPTLIQDFDCFNGAAFAENTPIFNAKVGERVRWRIAAFGKELHVFHLHGHRWQNNGRSEDSVMLGPATTLTFDYVEDNPGAWMYHCHMTEHMMGGMLGRYVVSA